MDETKLIRFLTKLPIFKHTPETVLARVASQGMESKINILAVTESDKQLIHHWPLELRALFDPAADRELARRIAEERWESEARHQAAREALGDAVPFLT